MKISAVLPVYNGEKYLVDTIESVLCQQHRAEEIIAVDDGSTDRSFDLLSSYGDKVRVTRQPNLGVCRARNRGVEEARGDWIALIDQDDIWYPHKLSTQVAFVEKHPEARFVFSDVDFIDDQGNVVARNASTVFTLDWIRPFIKGCYHPFPSTVLIRKDLFLAVGGFSTDFVGNAHEDVEFNARVCRAADLHFIAEPLVQYRFEEFAHAGRAHKRTGDCSDHEFRNIQKCFLANDRDYRFKNTITLYNKLNGMFPNDSTMKKPLRQMLRAEANGQAGFGKIYMSLGDYEQAGVKFRAAWRLRKRWKYLRKYLWSSLCSKWVKWSREGKNLPRACS